MVNIECEFFSIHLTDVPKREFLTKTDTDLERVDGRATELLTKESVNPALEEELRGME